MSERPPRVVTFISAELKKSGDRYQAKVELKRDTDRVCVGTAERPGTETLLCVAQATANALIQAVSSGREATGFALTVKEAGVGDVFGKQTVMVAVAGEYLDWKRDLLGVCVVDTDPVKAAALAMLNATNRFLGVG